MSPNPSLVEKAGKIEGRKKFQKIVHILQTKGADFHEKFTYHYYGAYSSDLQLEIDELSTRGGLIEEKNQYGGYTYSLEQGVTGDASLIPYSALIDYLNRQPSQVLELVSTFYYLQEHGFQDMKKIFNKTIQLKPHLQNKLENAQAVYAEIEKKYEVMQ